MPDLSLEQALATRCGGLVCGIDEVGRGPLAGPVVAAAAVILDPAALPPGLDDSKKLSARRREALFTVLWPDGPAVVVGVGAASAREIDAINILRATELAMNRAVVALSRRLGAPPAAALVDGNRVPPGLPCVAEAVVKGDGRSLSIAAASVVAKVLRDRLMTALDHRYPGYGWSGNAGYPTAAHRKAMARLGLSPHHRRTFNAQLPLFD